MVTKLQENNKNSERKNKNRIQYNYNIGNKVYISNKEFKRKFAPKERPFETVKFNTNETV